MSTEAWDWGDIRGETTIYVSFIVSEDRSRRHIKTSQFFPLASAMFDLLEAGADRRRGVIKRRELAWNTTDGGVEIKVVAHVPTDGGCKIRADNAEFIRLAKAFLPAIQAAL